MSVSPDEFLTTSSELLAGEREIDWRNAASRAYYGALHRAQTLLVQLDQPLPRGQSTHERTIKALTRSSDPVQEKLGRHLRKCKNFRVRSDYELSLRFNRSNAVRCLNLARQLFDMADRVESTAVNGANA